jgi:uncharacterized membrane protein HdeD (DUF308 family)
MTALLSVAGASILGGVAAVVAGGVFEIIRAFSNKTRREAILNRSFVQNLRQMVS